MSTRSCAGSRARAARAWHHLPDPVEGGAQAQVDDVVGGLRQRVSPGERRVAHHGDPAVGQLGPVGLGEVGQVVGVHVELRHRLGGRELERPADDVGAGHAPQLVTDELPGQLPGQRGALLLDVGTHAGDALVQPGGRELQGGDGRTVLALALLLGGQAGLLGGFCLDARALAGGALALGPSDGVPLGPGGGAGALRERGQCLLGDRVAEHGAAAEARPHAGAQLRRLQRGQRPLCNLGRRAVLASSHDAGLRPRTHLRSLGEP